MDKMHSEYFELIHNNTENLVAERRALDEKWSLTESKDAVVMAEIAASITIMQSALNEAVTNLNDNTHLKDIVVPTLKQMINDYIGKL